MCSVIGVWELGKKQWPSPVASSKSDLAEKRHRRECTRGCDELWWRWWWRKAVCVVLLDTFLPLRPQEEGADTLTHCTHITPHVSHFGNLKRHHHSPLYVSSIAALSMHRVALVGCLPALAESSPEGTGDQE